MATTKRKTLTLSIDLEGAALADDFADLELAQILSVAAERVKHGDLNDSGKVLAVGESFSLFDVNGNRVGAARVVMGADAR